MFLPINGRVAIIDDQLKHAEPLMKTLSKKQVPFTYFSGEHNFLPIDGENFNDIRVLFLDINLIDDGEHSEKVLKGRLIPVLKAVISRNNYPYILIYWSRHQSSSDKNLIEKEIFGKDLNDRQPIAYLSAVKSDFFNLKGETVDDYEEKIKSLFDKINLLISKLHAYSYLLNWENKVHDSADKTLEEIFSSLNDAEKWKENANYLFNKLGVSFSGSLYEAQKSENKIKSSYNALNIVFSDTLEHHLNNCIIINAKNLNVSSTLKNLESVFNINKKLLISGETEPIHYSGTVLEIVNSNINQEYENLLDTILKKTSNRGSIIGSWKKIWLNVTPLCDTVQGKIVFHRIVRGILVSKEFSESFYSNEAIYVSPQFTYDGKDYSIILDFRQFFTLQSLRKSKKRIPLFRIRQQVLAEIQSKLARHINRQGILFLSQK